MVAVKTFRSRSRRGASKSNDHGFGTVNWEFQWDGDDDTTVAGDLLYRYSGSFHHTNKNVGRV